MTEEQQSCGCPDVWPKWDGTDQSLVGKCVHRMSIAAFFHMPLAYETYMAKQHENIQQLELSEIWPRFVMVRTGMIGGEMIRFVHDAQSPSRFVQFLSPPFDVNVVMHEGGIGTVQKTLQAQQMRLVDSGRSPKEVYLAHLTCPVCEERKGGEKIMVVRRWVENARLKSRLETRQR